MTAWRERDKGNGMVERTYVDSPVRYGAQVGGTAAAYSATPVSAPKPAPKTKKAPEPIRCWSAKDAWIDLDVLVTEEAAGAIGQGVFWGTGQDNRESGGWLAGVSTDRTLLIAHATSRNPRDKRRHAQPQP